MFRYCGNYLIEERNDLFIGHYKAYFRNYKLIGMWTERDGIKTAKRLEEEKKEALLR